MESREVRARKDLSTDGLIRVIHDAFECVEDPRPGSVVIPVREALMSAFAMFSLKCPSLLAFDGERNATRRHLDQIRKDHPHLGFIVVEDGLSSNGPQIRDLMSHDMHFILGAKPDDLRFCSIGSWKPSIRAER